MCVCVVHVCVCVWCMCVCVCGVHTCMCSEKGFQCARAYIERKERDQSYQCSSSALVLVVFVVAIA